LPLLVAVLALATIALFGADSVTAAQQGDGVLVIKKICDPVDAEGEFQFRVDGEARGTIGCGESLTGIVLAAGTHRVSETLVMGFVTSFGPGCNSSGVVTVEESRTVTCTVTNTAEEQGTGSLTITKVCVPSNDDGAFVIRVDGVPQGSVACGGSVSDVELDAGSHTVSESGGAGTNIADYTRSFAGACNPNGTVHITAGADAQCTITNARIDASTATLRITKVCVPRNDDGEFILRLNGVARGRVACGESLGDVPLEPGSYAVSESGAEGTDLGNYARSFGGACNAAGVVEVDPGEDLTCTITNDVIEDRQSIVAPTVQPTAPPLASGTATAEPDGTSEAVSETQPPAAGVDDPATPGQETPPSGVSRLPSTGSPESPETVSDRLFWAAAVLAGFGAVVIVPIALRLRRRH
jgi:hypothetical protein